MQSKGRRWLWALLTALALVSVSWPLVATEKDPSQDKVAVVNGSVVTRAELDREMRGARRRPPGMGKPHADSQPSAMKQEALERLIDRELLYQESQKKGIKVDEKAVNEQLEMMKKQMPSEAEFEKRMSRMNITEASLKSQFARGMVIKELIDKEVLQKISIPDKEIKAYYDSHGDHFKQPEQVRASHILIKVDPKADESQKAEAKKTLEKAQKRLKEGEDFSALAKELSQCPSSAQGGDLSHFRRGQMVKPFDEAAFALKVGEISDIIETQFGYHLIKVLDKKAEGTTPYEEAKGRIEQRLKNEKAQEEYTSYVAKLKEKAKVERLLTEAPK